MDLKILRPSCTRVDHSDRFKYTNMPCERQYANIYFVRSALLHKRLECAALEKWGNIYPVVELGKLQLGVKSCIIGTLFKHAELQPSILKKVSEDHYLEALPKGEKYISDSDNLVLEDTTQRISLCGDINPDQFYTGTVIALAGVEEKPGSFCVEDFTFAGFPDISPLPMLDSDKYVLIVSGLGLGARNERKASIQLMVDYVAGLVGDVADLKLSASIIHMIIAGNSLSADMQDKDSQVKAKYLTYKEQPTTVSAMKTLDKLLSHIVPQISVDVMSGDNDPSNFLLPQQPLNTCMFTQASSFCGHSLCTVPNPYECDIEGVKFLGTSGQNIEDIRQYSVVDDSLSLMEYTFKCGHLAPTAPDSLGCFPYYKNDPFVILKDNGPHIYFVGNQPRYSSKIVTCNSGRSVLISIPSFHATQTAVLVNLRDLSCRPITFSADISTDESIDK